MGSPRKRKLEEIDASLPEAKMHKSSGADDDSRKTHRAPPKMKPELPEPNVEEPESKNTMPKTPSVEKSRREEVKLDVPWQSDEVPKESSDKPQLEVASECSDSDAQSKSSASTVFGTVEEEKVSLQSLIFQLD